ncbi:cortistatin [Spea bombifrons]|uniref:cortistatin n=1 Tax=Spea bombifrons TaxID=233779 RepID=UPI00234A340C|nr:cortistatin [Spea bombifrons]
MQLLGSAGSLLLLLAWTVGAASQPEDERMRMIRNQDLGAMQKDLLLKLLSGLMDHPPEADAEASDPVEPNAIPHSPSMKFPHLPPRERKAPCKNFFWKTFTVC